MKKCLVIGIVIAVMMTMIGISGCSRNRHFSGFNHGYDMDYNCVRDHWEYYTTEYEKSHGNWLNRRPAEMWFNFKI